MATVVGLDWYRQHELDAVGMHIDASQLDGLRAKLAHAKAAAELRVDAAVHGFGDRVWQRAFHNLSGDRHVTGQQWAWAGRTGKARLARRIAARTAKGKAVSAAWLAKTSATVAGQVKAAALKRIDKLRDRMRLVPYTPGQQPALNVRTGQLRGALMRLHTWLTTTIQNNVFYAALWERGIRRFKPWGKGPGFPMPARAWMGPAVAACGGEEGFVAAVKAALEGALGGLA